MDSGRWQVGKADLPAPRNDAQRLRRDAVQFGRAASNDRDRRRTSRFRPAVGTGAGTRVLCPRQWCGRGNGAPVHGRGCEGLAQRAIVSLRYQFPYMEQRSKRPDRPELAQATVRAAAAQALRLAPGLPLIAGGKSFGGRMTSQAQAAAALPGVRGLAFLGFPLHPAKRPSIERARNFPTCSCRCCFCKASATRSPIWQSFGR